MEQQIKFCTTRDGVRIAYSAVGDGEPFVKVANWLNHLEMDWISPVWSHWLAEFGRGQKLIRYDERATGLSDRNVDDLSLDAFVDDLKSVVDALGLKCFPMLAISQGGPVAIAYAARYPEKVSHLVIYGSFATGWKKGKLSESDREKREAQLALIKQGWDSKNPAIRQLFTTTCLPGGSSAEHTSFNELQRESVSAGNAARIFEAIGELDVADVLPELKVPTIVLHSKFDAMVPFEEGRKLASMIPDARFIPLESSNHILLRSEPAWERFRNEVNSFLGRANSLDSNSSTVLERRCPKCHRSFSEEMFFCLDDGEKLVDFVGADADQKNGELTKIFGLEKR